MEPAHVVQSTPNEARRVEKSCVPMRRITPRRPPPGETSLCCEIGMTYAHISKFRINCAMQPAPLPRNPGIPQIKRTKVPRAAITYLTFSSFFLPFICVSTPSEARRVE